MHEMGHSGDNIRTNGYNVTAFLKYMPITDHTPHTTFGANFSATHERWYDERSYEAAKLRKLEITVCLSPMNPPSVRSNRNCPLVISSAPP